MKKAISTIILIILGILLSVNVFSKKEEIITLTEDNHILFSGPVTDESVAAAQQELLQEVKKARKHVTMEY